MSNSNKMYYAEFDGGQYTGLWRFESKQDRDDFVSSLKSYARSISSKDARSCYRKQFKIWSEK